jgi:hypothetical protein
MGLKRTVSLVQSAESALLAESRAGKISFSPFLIQFRAERDLRKAGERRQHAFCDTTVQSQTPVQRS